MLCLPPPASFPCFSPLKAKKPEPAKEAPSKKEEKEVGKKAEGAAVESEAKTSDEKSCAALLATMVRKQSKPQKND